MRPPPACAPAQEAQPHTSGVNGTFHTIEGKSCVVLTGNGKLL